MFAIIKAKQPANRDSVCVIDSKKIKKGEDVVLLGNKVKGQKIREWEVACIAPKCANKVEKWISEQPETAPTPSQSASKGYSDLSIIDAFQLIASGNQKRDSRLDESEGVIDEQRKQIASLSEQVAKLMDAVRLPESSPSNPPRPPADADNKPTNCLGVSKSTGNACKQTQNRLEANGYCGQHQSQSGDSERAELDKHSNEVRRAQQQDVPAVPADLLELLG